MIFLQLFWTFFKIGSFTIGGGYAMVPIIEEELVRKKKWIDSSEFVDILALSQSAPGILAVNISIVTGYRIRKFTGYPRDCPTLVYYHIAHCHVFQAISGQ